MPPAVKFPWKFLVFFALSLFFFWVWYERCLRWEFNELGRYYDPETETVYTDSGFIWSIPAFAFLLPALLHLRSAVRYFVGRKR